MAVDWYISYHNGIFNWYIVSSRVSSPPRQNLKFSISPQKHFSPGISKSDFPPHSHPFSYNGSFFLTDKCMEHLKQFFSAEQSYQNIFLQENLVQEEHKSRNQDRWRRQTRMNNEPDVWLNYKVINGTKVNRRKIYTGWYFQGVYECACRCVCVCVFVQ